MDFQKPFKLMPTGLRDLLGTKVDGSLGSLLY